MVQSETNTVISSLYQPLYSPPTKYVLITGGRGSQKSYAVSSWIAECLTDFKNWVILYTRWTMKNVETSILPEFTEKLDLLGKRKRVRPSGNILYCDDKSSKVIFSGIKVQSLNQTANLKGTTGLNVFIVDEAEEFVSEKDFNTIARSVRQKGVPNIVVVIMNPQDAEHWVYKRWIEKTHRMVNLDGRQIPISTHPQVTHIHTTWIDNVENLEQSFIDDALQTRKDNRPEYDHQFLGAWLDKKEGAIYQDWEEGEFDTTLPYCYGLDFGFTNPDAMCKVAVDTNRMRVYVDEKMYATKQSDESIKSKVLEIAGTNDMVVSDNNESRIISGIANRGVNIQEVDKYPGCVVDRIRIMSKFTWVVTPESHNAKFEFRNYVWNDKKAEIPVDKHNHIIKAAEYAATRLLQGSDFLADNI